MRRFLIKKQRLQSFNSYRINHLKFDLISGFVVFLIAIPLCLGVSLASGAPLFSGILSGIMGGILVGILSGSQINISGPSAGMAAIVFSCITELGSFDAFLLALLGAGLIQILLGFLKAGFIAEYIPSNVLDGFLCAVGILLITKELPLAFTLSHSLNDLKILLLDTSEGFSLQPLRDLSFHINSGAAFISVSSLLILFLHDKTKISWIKNIPSPLLVVIFGVFLNEFLNYIDSYLAQNGPHLVSIPKHQGFTDFYQKMHTPDWSAWSNPQLYFLALMLSLAASLDNLININAGEKLDKEHRYFSKNRELIAQGFGNFCAALIGGIPITSVIIRTSINIQSGAKTKMSNIFHGFYILLVVMLFPDILNKIPLSSLAAILIHTGYKLTKPSLYLKLYHQGRHRFIPFIATVIGIVFFNLLIGVLIGLTMASYYLLKLSSQARLDIIKEIYPNGITHRIVLPQHTTFLNKASLILELDSIPQKSQLIIDARYTEYIDQEIVELIKEFQNQKTQHKQISLNLIGFKDQYKIHNFIHFINVTTYDVQSNLRPIEILNILSEGNQRFLNDTRIHRSFKIDIKHTATKQHPIAVILGCIDSRVPVETIFDMSFGDLFCIRIAGTVVNDDILASIEYATHVIGAKLIVVLGHSQCGAIGAACDGITKKGHIDQLLEKIKPAISAEQSTKNDRNTSNHEFIHKVTELNIAHSLLTIYQESKILKNMIDEDKVGMVGAIYDLASGQVRFKDYSQKLMQFKKKYPARLAEKLKQLITTSSQK